MTEIPGIRAVRALLLTLAAFLAGGLAYFSFAPYSRSASMVISVAFFIIIIAAHVEWTRSAPNRKFSAFGWPVFYGIFWGLGLYLPLYSWIAEFVESAPWIALSLLMALFTGAIGGFSGLILYSVRSRASWVPIVAIPLVWTAVEVARMHFPFGGFTWGSPAFSQTSSVLGSASLWGSTSAVTFLTIFSGSVVAYAMRLFIKASKYKNRALKKALRSFTASVLALLVTISSSWLYEHTVGNNIEPVGSIKVAYIQGDVVTEGIGFNAVRMQVLRNHVNTTKQLAAAVAEGRVARPDVVVWPENSADIDPLADPTANALITSAAKAIDAPILVGAVLGRQSQQADLNTVLLWDSSGYRHQRHVKRHIQPFGEYLPMRPLVEKISPYAAWAGNFNAGDGPGIITLPSSTVGLATCYEVIFNDSLQKPVKNGAQWLAVPANNATFGYTNQTYQQLEITRFRARELHRWTVAAATSGVSAFISPSGDVYDATELYTSAFSVKEIPLYDFKTPAERTSKYLDLAVSVASILILGGCLARVLSRRRRRL